MVTQYVFIKTLLNDPSVHSERLLVMRHTLRLGEDSSLPSMSSRGSTLTTKVRIRICSTRVHFLSAGEATADQWLMVQI